MKTPCAHDLWSTSAWDAGRRRGRLPRSPRQAAEKIDASAESSRPLSQQAPAQILVGKRAPAPQRQIHQISVPAPNNLKRCRRHSPPACSLRSYRRLGSGKSTLVNDILYAPWPTPLYRSQEPPGANREIVRADQIDKVIEIDQKPPAAATRAQAALNRCLRRLFPPASFRNAPESANAATAPAAQLQRIKGGRCEKPARAMDCGRIEMNFSSDVYVQVRVCRGRATIPKS